MQSFDIYFLGESLPGADPVAVRRGVAKLFKVQEASLSACFPATAARETVRGRGCSEPLSRCVSRCRCIDPDHSERIGAAGRQTTVFAGADGGPIHRRDNGHWRRRPTIRHR